MEMIQANERKAFRSNYSKAKSLRVARHLQSLVFPALVVTIQWLLSTRRLVEKFKNFNFHFLNSEIWLIVWR